MNRPRAQLQALRAMWGRLRIVEGTEEAPLIIERKTPHGRFEVWKRIEGSGLKAWFQRVDEET